MMKSCKGGKGKVYKMLDTEPAQLGGKSLRVLGNQVQIKRENHFVLESLKK